MLVDSRVEGINQHIMSTSNMHYDGDALRRASGDMDTCPICYEDIDLEMEMIKMPNCEHKMHTGCYAMYMKYYVDQFNRDLREDNRAAAINNEIACPFCRKMVVRLEPQGARWGPLQQRFVVAAPLSIELAGGGSTDDDLTEFVAIVERREKKFYYCALFMCGCALLWVTLYITHLAFIYDGNDITFGTATRELPPVVKDDGAPDYYDLVRWHG